MYLHYCKLSKGAKIREKCMVVPPSVHPNHPFSVFLAIYESSYNIEYMRPISYSFRKWLI
jgi:hypothetical protein